jgi:signal transduction histidine kinase
MKNAMRATVEHSKATGRIDHPPIEVTIVEGGDDISIRLRDQGGGIPASLLPFVFDYSFTSVPKDEDDGFRVLFMLDMFSAQAGMQNATGGPMAGLGFGLGLSRVYARYFGGSLELTSISGHGVDLFLHLPHINAFSPAVIKEL